MDPEDSWEQHAADTLREGYWLGDPLSVELLCREAPAAIDDLVRWGARLAREDDGRLTQRFFGAHRYRRTCFAGDYTGREIQRTLVAARRGARASRCATTSTSRGCSSTTAASSAPTASTSTTAAAG